MQHVCTATDQSYLPYSCLSECMALILRKCWAIEKDFISMQFASLKWFLLSALSPTAYSLNG